MYIVFPSRAWKDNRNFSNAVDVSFENCVCITVEYRCNLWRQEHRDKSKRKRIEKEKVKSSRKKNTFPSRILLNYWSENILSMVNPFQRMEFGYEREATYADNNLLCTVNNVILVQRSERWKLLLYVLEKFPL